MAKDVVIEEGIVESPVLVEATAEVVEEKVETVVEAPDVAIEKEVVKAPVIVEAAAEILSVEVEEATASIELVSPTSSSYISR